MKKLLLFVFATVLTSASLFAQFTLSTKIAKGQGPNSNFLLYATSVMTNMSSDIADTLFDWKIIEINKPTEWKFGMCDPNNCLDEVLVNGTGTFTLLIDQQGEFKGDFSPNSTGGSGDAKVTITSRKNPSYTDTLVYMINAWATGLREVKKAAELSFYPNPVKDKLTIKLPAKQPVTIDVYNVLGNKVKSLVHTGGEYDYNLSDLKSGLYFLRYNENGKVISKSFNVVN